jgi:hypothetical protein
MKREMTPGMGYGVRNLDEGDAGMENASHARLQAEHASKDEFVKRQQAETARFGGREPKLKEASMRLDAYMCNDGDHAKEFGRKLTEGLDKTVYPVR